MENLPNQLAPTSLITALSSKSKPNRNDSGGKLLSKGSRNNDFASLAGSLRKRGVGADMIEAALQAMNKKLDEPLEADEVSAISGSIGSYAVQPNFFTHDRFATYLADELRGKLLYCEGYGFLIYQDGYWQDDREGLRVTFMVREIVAKVRSQLSDFCNRMDEKQQAAFLKGAAKLESADFVRSSIKLMQSDPSMRVQYSELNANKMLLNLNNGTFDLQTWTLRPFDPADKLSFKLDIAYDPKADCPLFRKFLADILPEDVGFFMLRSLGYGLLGHAREHKLFILQGTGRNGKSTLLEIMTALFGSLMVTIQPESLNGRMEGAIRNDLARLAGKRFMITSETKAGTVLDAPLVKQITGLDTLTARFLHKEFFDFQARVVPFLVTNYLPVVDGSDFAMAERLLVIGFDTVITSPDRQLSEKLKAEASGIFNLVLAGMKDYQANGLMIPASVAERSKTFIERSNLLKGFFDDTFEMADGESVMASGVYSSHESWCKENGYRPMSMNTFKDAFERTTGIAQERNNQGRYWPNMRRKGGKFTI